MWKRLRDRELSPELLAQKKRRARIFEINAQVEAAVRRGVPLETILSHPAGPMGPGSERHLNENRASEIAFITQRYDALKASRDRGTLLDDYADRLEDSLFVQWLRKNGAEIEVAEEEIVLPAS